jgi:hypothetical protein
MFDVILSGTFVFNDVGEILFLFRSDHSHYEKPGGKLEREEVSDWEHPTMHELLSRARKELVEEAGNVAAERFEYLCYVDAKIPGGRVARVHAFTARYAGGDISPTEKKFAHAKFISLDDVRSHTMSPDFAGFFEKLKEYREKNF